MKRLVLPIHVLFLLAASFLITGTVGAGDPENSSKQATTIDLRAVLEKGKETGSLPEGFIIRLSGCLQGSQEEISGKPVFDQLVETWEFTSGRVTLTKFEHKNDPLADLQGESRLIDSKRLCKDLLEGRAIEIQERKGIGPEVGFIGSHYDLGSRSIEVVCEGETVLHLFETNGPFLRFFRESDACAFGALYERLTSQAKGVFVRQASKKTSPSQSDTIAWGEAVNGLQMGIYTGTETDGNRQTLFDGGTLRVGVQLRNTGKSPLRFIPATFSCAALGSDAGIPVTKVILTPSKGGEPLSIVYAGHNHVSDEEPLDADELEHFSTELAPGKSLTFPYWLEFTPGESRESRWQRPGDSNLIPEGTYHLKAELIVDRKGSEWKGMLTSGSLEVDIRGIE